MFFRSTRKKRLEMKKVSKLEALAILVDECVAAHQNAVKTLTPNKEALAMYHNWMQGYLAYHIYAERYRLNELGFGVDQCC
ncbi:hypothetical protein K435DRAFT_870995 [Dendrothele bispora CBS 962.96]|uniref:Uncharacterized protein n=1 Tax=Dendrothele bispora (strain CBS 962.96) TaxID=1314807 RepID=A0A4S8L5V7_DENBC|nr:hypothetical protein K435DRAFT_870995 [Dendrothele bispora CBS 962.96]